MDLTYVSLAALAVTMCVYNEDPTQLSFACMCGLCTGLIVYLLSSQKSICSLVSNPKEHFDTPSFPAHLNKDVNNVLDGLCPKTNYAYSLYPKPFMADATTKLMCTESGFPLNSEYTTNSKQICLGDVSKRILSSRGGNA